MRPALLAFSLLGSALTAAQAQPRSRSNPTPSNRSPAPAATPAQTEPAAALKKISPSGQAAPARTFRSLGGDSAGPVTPAASASHGNGHYEFQKNGFRSLEIGPTTISPSGAAFVINNGRGPHLPPSSNSSGGSANNLGAVAALANK